MGIDYDRLMDMSWGEYNYMTAGYQRKIERNWDYVRHMIAASYNSSGFSKTHVKALSIMNLPYLDKAEKFREVDAKKIKRMLEIMRHHGNN